MMLRMGEPGEFAMWLAIGGTFVTTLLGPIGQELETERGQLEERLDFAERMLTRGADEARAGLKADG